MYNRTYVLDVYDGISREGIFVSCSIFYPKTMVSYLKLPEVELSFIIIGIQ